MAAISIADRQAASAPAPDTITTADFNVADMALYGLKRARARLTALDAKPVWDAADTASFDCMHYLGDTALHAAARALRLQPGARVVDVGAGFGATGRFLHRHYGADVTGIELQSAIHDLAETITARNRLSAHARSLNADFTTLAPAAVGAPVDHVVSFLCILHIPDRAAVFSKTASLLRRDGGIYVEDFFARKELDAEMVRKLRDVVSCPYLPSRERYVADLEGAGFGDVVFEEVTDAWADYVHARAIEYRRSSEPEPFLMTFYDTIDELFQGGKLGGARIMARKIE
ncbi:methyl transferase-like protein [Cordyceps fumosorosea ARSEF 2679]|uniref:phosphoethanolamine N-methyltransferase n=1 Tax=Cordyceps fumosorosea (strain ARSEF 2679) TaxID=1081104 RepID=A0A167PZS4_CORFA|nr:methyl transferase-like protein [Cordyceps fumosorosea ARSEF 2679]OAA57163.1 methyl transferase-like protein [Cordyceps fumosorosea ARSEF 2679]